VSIIAQRDIPDGDEPIVIKGQGRIASLRRANKPTEVRNFPCLAMGTWPFTAALLGVRRVCRTCEYGASPLSVCGDDTLRMQLSAGEPWEVLSPGAPSPNALD
jgi:hypothetical protein